VNFVALVVPEIMAIFARQLATVRHVGYYSWARISRIDKELK
jgi:hypothetical protein